MTSIIWTSLTCKSPVERFNRTFKERLWVYMTDYNKERYIDVLPEVVKGYNDSVHSSTGFAPSAVGDEHVIQILRAESPAAEPTKGPAFRVDDYVRVAKTKLTFEKGYETKYSQMLFKISGIRQTNEHYIYSLRDLANHSEPG